MSTDAARVRWFAVAVFVGVLIAGAGVAHGQTTCMTDKDCPGTTCGSQVCLHNSGVNTCVDANTAGASGLSDGWCANSDGTAIDSNCKCAAQGATCQSFFCSFTIPPGTGSGGSTGSGGAAGGSTGSGGSAGTSGAGGEGGGCSVAGGPSIGWAGVGMLIAAALVRCWRRRA